MYYVDKDIKKTERIFPRQERYGYYRYDMNENPEGLPEEFVQSVLKEVTPEFLSIYPEPNRFLTKYAKYVGVERENVIATNGSDMAIRSLLQVFGEKGKEVVTVTPSFEMYMVNCWILGLIHKPVSYEPDMTLSIDKIVNAITEDTRIVALLNPNNPMDNAYAEEEAELVIARAKEVGAIVIIDEAYHYFYQESLLNCALKHDNVVVLRTFSKLYSIAACRLGVIIGHPQLIHYLENAKLTFDVNSFALLFGERLLEHPEIRDELIRKEAEGKKYTIEKLTERGYECRSCKGNFLFVKPRHDAKEIAKRLEEEKKVLVHAYGNPVLKDYLRISVGSVPAMDIFLKAFFEIDEA